MRSTFVYDPEVMPLTMQPEILHFPMLHDRMRKHVTWWAFCTAWDALVITTVIVFGLQSLSFIEEEGARRKKSTARLQLQLCWCKELRLIYWTCTERADLSIHPLLQVTVMSDLVMCKDSECTVKDPSERNMMQVSIILIVKMLCGLPPSNIMLHTAGNVSLSLPDSWPADCNGSNDTPQTAPDLVS